MNKTMKRTVTFMLWAITLCFYPTLQEFAYLERGYYAHGGGEELLLIAVTILVVWGWWD